MKSERKLHNDPVPRFRLRACAIRDRSCAGRVWCGVHWCYLASMPPLDSGLRIRELLDRSAESPKLNPTQHVLTLCRIQPADGQGQESHARVNEVAVGVIKFDGLHRVHQSVNQGGAHALAPSLCKTVDIGAGRCRCTPLSVKRTPSVSSTPITR